MTAQESLRRCVEALRLIDRAECKDDAVWAAVVDAQAEAERVLKAPVPEPVAHLRFRAAQSWGGSGNQDIDHNEWFEVCNVYDIGDDKLPAFPVYVEPVAPPSVAAHGVPEPEPVAWIVFAEDQGVMVPQHPAYAVKLMADRSAALYGQTPTEVRPLYAAPATAAPVSAADAKLIEALKDCARHPRKTQRENIVKKTLAAINATKE